MPPFARKKNADAEVDDAHSVRPRSLGQPADDVAAERIVSQKDVADAGDKDAGGLTKRFNLVDAEEKTVAGLSLRAEIVARIVVHRDCEVKPAFQILLDRDDGCDLSFKVFF